MRKITCQVCKNHHGHGAQWTVFKECHICEACRLVVVHWFLESDEFGFGHPFVAEFMSTRTQIDISNSA